MRNKFRSTGKLVAAMLAAGTAFVSHAQDVDVAALNAGYKDPDLQVEVWVGRLESEGREAFDFRNQIAAAIGLEPGESIADVGAGTGLYTPLLAQLVGPAGRVFAVDIVPRFIEHIRDQVALRGLTQVTPVLGSDVSANLPAGSVDIVFVCDTYHHFEDYNAMLQSIHAALKPGGRLVVVDFEREDGVSSEFTLQHIRADKETFTAEIEANGFRYTGETDIDGMNETFMRHFEKN